MPKGKKLKFNVGDRVGDIEYEDYNTGDLKYGLRYEEYDDREFGVITDVLSNGKVSVKWDSDYLNSNENYNKPLDPKQLMLESEIKTKLPILEKEYNDVCKQISVKMKEAGKLLREANKMAKKTGNELANMDAIDPLYSAMDACGWRTSSFGC